MHNIPVGVSAVYWQYWQLKNEMLEAFRTYESAPTAENKFNYNLLTQRWRDFCVEAIAALVGDNLAMEVAHE